MNIGFPRHIHAFDRVKSPERLARSFVVLVCLSILGITGWRLNQAYDLALSESHTSSAILARAFTEHANATVAAGDVLVSGMVERLETNGISADAVERLQRMLMARVNGQSRVRELVVLAADGSWLASSIAHPSGRPDNDREYFRYHRSHEERSAHIGRPVLSRVSGRWTLTITRRFNQPDGTFGGVALAAIDFSVFENFYSAFDVGPNGLVTLANEDATRIVRVPSAPELIGEDLTDLPTFQAYRVHGPVGATASTSPLDGVLRHTSFRRVENYPLVVFVSMAQDDILAVWRGEALTAGAAACVLSLILGVLGWRLAAQIRLRHEAETAVRQSDSQYRLLADHSTDLVVQLDASGRRTYVSPACLPMLGFTPEEMLGQRPRDICHPDDWPAVETALATELRDGGSPPFTFRARRKDGASIWLEAVTRRLSDDQGIVAAIRDVAARKEVEQLLHKANNELQRMVTRDGLTGIANRLCFDRALAKEYRRASRSETPLALLLLDVDHFKRYNDAYGHPAGDACLRAIADALAKQSLRPADLTARYGGEEFAVLLPDTDNAGVLRLAERARAAIRDLAIVHRDNLDGIATISVGAAVIWPRNDGLTADDLVHLADKALYRAKASGRDCVCVERTEPPLLDLAGLPFKPEPANPVETG